MAIEPTLLLWLATDRGLVSRHLLNQSRNPIQGLLVRNANGDALVMHNLAIEFVALDAHELTAAQETGACRTLSHR